MKKIFLLLFLLASAGELLSIAMSLPLLHMLCKPLLMILLCAYYLSAIDASGRSWIVVAALLFSAAGDTLLMVNEHRNGYFVPGLVFFLLAHVAYIFSYRQHRVDEHANALQGVQRLRLAFPIVLAITGLVIVLYPVLGALKIPVLVYATVMLLMVLNALFRYGRTPSTSFINVFIGALLFMFSDSILAINKFLQPVMMAGLLIMTLYIAGQFLIVRGLIVHTK